MFNLPAICDVCGMNFPSGYSAGPGTRMTLRNNISGPCPNCGGIGRVPDGIYDIINEVEATLQVDKGKQVYKLQRILNTASTTDTISSINNKIKEETPQYEGIIGAIEYFFTRTKNTFEALAAVSTLVFGIMGVIPDKFTTDGDSTIRNNQQQVIKEQRNLINDYKEQNEILKSNNESNKNKGIKEEKEK